MRAVRIRDWQLQAVIVGSQGGELPFPKYLKSNDEPAKPRTAAEQREWIQGLDLPRVYADGTPARE